MHISQSKFKYKDGTLIGYCGDMNPPPLWSNLRFDKEDSEIGIFLYVEYMEEIHRIRFYLNDTVKDEKGAISCWYLYPFLQDKKDFPNLHVKKIIILNEFNPEKKEEVFA